MRAICFAAGKARSCDEGKLLNPAFRPQQTIAKPARVHGVGYWSGQSIQVEFRPASVDAGIVFVRSDLGGSRIPARVENRVEVPRRTNLVAADASVEMVEHVMAALAGLQIDNCEVWVDAAEMPGCDGSSAEFVDALDAAGIQSQNAPRAALAVRQVTRVGDADAWVEARPADEFSLECNIHYANNRAIGQQTFGPAAMTPKRFRDELASARTFLLEEEANWLRERGIGGHVSLQDLLIFDDDGPKENPLRFENECVRHKTLDMIGDLALAGCDLQGHFTAHGAGHRLNAELVKQLLADAQVMEGLRKTA